MNIELISIDMDGTLLSDDMTIHKDNIEAINYCLQNDIKVVLNTGRSFTIAEPILKNYKLNELLDHSIFLQGSTIYDLKSKESIYSSFMNKNEIQQLQNHLETFDIGILYYEDEIVYVHKDHESVSIYESIASYIPDRKHLSAVTGDLSKLLIIASPELVEKIVDTLPDGLQNKYSHFYSHTHFYEFTNLNTSKGLALKRLCDTLSIDIKDTLAIGDNGNDLSMIQIAGVGATLSNGIDSLKQHCDYISAKDNNNGGVAEIINKFVRKE